MGGKVEGKRQVESEMKRGSRSLPTGSTDFLAMWLMSEEVLLEDVLKL